MIVTMVPDRLLYDRLKYWRLDVVGDRESVLLDLAAPTSRWLGLPY